MDRTPTSLATQWRDEANTLRRRGAAAQAVSLESCAELLETALREQALESCADELFAFGQESIMAKLEGQS